MKLLIVVLARSWAVLLTNCKWVVVNSIRIKKWVVHSYKSQMGYMFSAKSELWAYSGAWLALGAALMAAGWRSGLRGLRLAALSLVALVAAKVFLVDMAGLGGLWRVLSFLGLGLSLIGLGAFYRRFVVTAP